MIELWLMTEKDRDGLEATDNEHFSRIQVLEKRVTVLEAAFISLGGVLGEGERASESRYELEDKT